MQMFVYTECSDFLALVEMECRQITGSRPVIYSTPEDLRNMLSLFPVIDFLIIDLPEDTLHCEELKAFVTENQSRMKKVILVGLESGHKGHVYYYKRTEISELFDNLRALSGEDVSMTSWTAIPLCTLIHFPAVPFDLYIRLSDRKYVKRINAHEEVGKETLEALKEKGVEELYCEKRYTRDFSMMLINNMINKVDRQYDNLLDEMNAQDEVFSTTKEIIQNLGLSGRVVEVCDAAIEKMCLEVLSEPDEFAAFLTAMRRDKNMAFHFKLVNLTNYIGTQLILQMNLPNTDEQVKKFVFASYFCDMTLKNPGFHFHRKSEDTEALTLEDQNDVNFHALRSSELVSGYREISKETCLIIKQHHGSFSGIGFPAEKSGQLLPLTKILIVSQELAFTILTNGDTPVLDTLRIFVKKHKVKGLIDLMNVLEKSFNDQLNEVI